MVVAELLSLSLALKLLGCQVVSALVLPDQEVLHGEGQEGRDSHHHGANHVSANETVLGILSPVDLASNGSTNVSERDNGCSSNATLGVT